MSRWDDRVSTFTWKHFGQRWQDISYGDFLGAFQKFVGEAVGAIVVNEEIVNEEPVFIYRPFQFE